VYLAATSCASCDRMKKRPTKSLRSWSSWEDLLRAKPRPSPALLSPTSQNSFAATSRASQWTVLFRRSLRLAQTWKSVSRNQRASVAVVHEWQPRRWR